MKVGKETVARRSLWWSVRRLNSTVPYRRPCFQVPRVLSPGNRPVASNRPAAERTEISTALQDRTPPQSSLMYTGRDGTSNEPTEHPDTKRQPERWRLDY